MAMGGYSIMAMCLFYLWILMSILFMAISVYFIYGYWCVLYLWLWVAILLWLCVYSIYGYGWLLYYGYVSILFMAMGGYSIMAMCLFYLWLWVVILLWLWVAIIL
jgi:hypothetical protein